MGRANKWRRSSSRSPPTEIPSRRPGVSRLGGDIVHVVGYACLLLQGVVLCWGDAKSAQDRLRRVRSVQFACLIGSAASSISSVQGIRANCLRPFSSVTDLSRPWPLVTSRCGVPAFPVHATTICPTESPAQRDHLVVAFAAAHGGL